MKTLGDVVSDLAQTNTKLDRRGKIKKKSKNKIKRNNVVNVEAATATNDFESTMAEKSETFLSIFLFGFWNFVYRCRASCRVAAVRFWLHERGTVNVLCVCVCG